MKSIEIILLEEDELPFYTTQTTEIIARNFGDFTRADRQLLEDLTEWLGYKKEAEPAD